MIAARWKLDRAELDRFAALSHARAAATDFSGEIAPISRPDGTAVDTDETIRPGTTAEQLARLDPAFRSPEMSGRFPEIGWQVTAGNSSQLADGASAVLIMSEERGV